MGAHLLILLAAALSSATQSDTAAPFATPATRVLVERAMARRQAQDSLVRDYTARLRYRLSVSVGRRRWGRSPVAGVEEQEASIHWQRPSDLRVDVIGRRFKGRVDGFELSSVFDHPWFVPRSVDDSVRIFSNDFPATGALHPLAAGAETRYDYAIVDSVQVLMPDGRRLRLTAIEVRPREIGPALVAGRIWLDVATAEVVRFTFRYVGTELWARPGEEGRDSGSARRINRLVNRVLSLDADLEYAIQEGRFWMPYRQTVSGRVEIPIVSDLVIPFQAVTTFRDYDINTGTPITWSLPLPDSGATVATRRARRDSVEAERRSDGRRDRDRSWDYAERWPGGRFELHRPGNDSLAEYHGWKDSLVVSDAADDARLRQAQRQLAALSEDLPDELTGRRAHGFGYERVSDAIQYNRVQGFSFGLGYQVRAPGRFNDVYGTVRYGLSDRRFTGRLSFIRDAPQGRLTVSGYHDLADVDPLSPGRNLANSANAMFTAHDEADYELATGGLLSYETALGVGLDLRVSARLERERSVVRRAFSHVNDFLGGDGRFPEVTPIAEDTYAAGAVQLEGYGGLRWTLAADGLSGTGRSVVRGWGAAQRSVGGTRGATLQVQAGITSDTTLPQMLFRAGGLNTVRGFGYATQIGQAIWTAQLDVTPVGGSFRPVFFIDAGHAAAPRDLFGTGALVGGGVGLSVYSRLLRMSLVRFNLSHPISPGGGKWRFDVVFQAVR